MSDFTAVQLLNQLTPVIITGGYVPRGAYAAGTDYAVGDSVDYNGSSYVMYVDAAAGTAPTDTTKWQVLANKGDTGSTGATGSTGSTGATGASITSAAFSSNDIVFTKDDTNTVTLTDAAITLKGATGATGGTGTLEDLGGATKALDNLASVAINTSLISDTDSTDDLGSTTKQWANVHTDRLVSTIADLVIENDLSDGDITFKVNDGGVDTTVMTLDGTTGNVGIGTTSPGTKLDVVGTARATGTLSLGADLTFTGNANLTASSGYLVIGANSGLYLNNSLLANSDGTPDIGAFNYRIRDLWLSRNALIAGNVGIGTTSPGYKLELVSDNSNALYIHPAVGVAGGYPKIQLDRTGAGGTLAPVGSITAEQQGLVLRSDGTNGPAIVLMPYTNVGIGTFSSGSVPGSKLSVNGNLAVGSAYSLLAAPPNGAIIEGSVGIGTTSPGTKLSVAGAGSFAGSLNVAFSDGNGQTTTTTALGLSSNPSGRTPLLVLSMPFMSGGQWQSFQANGGERGRIAYETTNGIFGFTVAGGDYYGTAPVIISGGNYTTGNGSIYLFPRDTGNVVVQPQLAASKALIVRGFTSQTGNLFEWQNSSSTGLGAIDSSGNVGIGTTAPTNILSLGGNSARTFWLERHTTANTAGNILTITAGGATSGATDKAGGDLILTPGLSTGTGESGVQIKGVPAGSTGTTDGTQTLMIQVLGNKFGVFAATPVVKQTGIAALKVDYTAGDLDTEAEIITALNTTNTAINALRTALNNYGFTTVV